MIRIILLSSLLTFGIGCMSVSRVRSDNLEFPERVFGCKRNYDLWNQAEEVWCRVLTGEDPSFYINEGRIVRLPWKDGHFVGAYKGEQDGELLRGILERRDSYEIPSRVRLPAYPVYHVSLTAGKRGNALRFFLNMEGSRAVMVVYEKQVVSNVYLTKAAYDQLWSGIVGVLGQYPHRQPRLGGTG